MATTSVTKSHHGTLTTTNEDIVKLTQFWDGIEIENKDGSQPLYVRMDGTASVAAAAGTEFVGPGDTKVFRAGIRTSYATAGQGVPGNTTTPPHYVSLIGSGNAYAVSGVAGAS